MCSLFNNVSIFPRGDEEWLRAIVAECRELEEEMPVFVNCAAVFRKVVSKTPFTRGWIQSISQECNILRLLSKEGEDVPAVTYVGRAAPFFNMERLPGITLRQFITRRGKDTDWDEGTRLSVARGIGGVMGGMSRRFAGKRSGSLRFLPSGRGFTIPAVQDIERAARRIGPEVARMCEQIIGDCGERVGNAADAIFHGDMNDGNVMVKEADEEVPVFSGVIDWELISREKPACFFNRLSSRFSAGFVQEAVAAYAGKTGCDLNYKDVQLTRAVVDAVAPLLYGQDEVLHMHKVRAAYNRIYNPGGPKGVG